MYNKFTYTKLHVEGKHMFTKVYKKYPNVTDEMEQILLKYVAKWGDLNLNFAFYLQDVEDIGQHDCYIFLQNILKDVENLYKYVNENGMDIIVALDEILAYA